MSEIRSQATPAYKAVAKRRAATHALHRDLLDGGPRVDAKFSDIHHMAGNAIRHGWSKTSLAHSAADLEALPDGSVVLFGDQPGIRRKGGNWDLVGLSGFHRPADLMDFPGLTPAVVLHIPNGV